jgi:hypothetical protein
MRQWRLGLAGMLCAGWSLVAAVPALGASGSGAVGTIRPAGVVTLRSLPAARVTPSGLLRAGALGQRVRLGDPRETSGGEAPGTAVGFPSPAGLPVVDTPDRLGWEGITNLEQELAPGNGGFAVEPPDQGLCVGSFKGAVYAFESVNLALQVYDTHGAALLPGTVSLNSFFGLAPSVSPSGAFGPFVSDPKCYFDPTTHRWFHTALVISSTPKGKLHAPAFTALAVSASSDPLGKYYLYRIPATDFAQPHCPCFGDQPLIGADKYGFYVNTSEYPINFNLHFSNFAQLYAMSKQALESGRPLRFVHFRNLTTQPVGGRTTATIQPAFTDAPGQYQLGHGGTEFFLSGFDCVPVSCNLAPGTFDQLSVWAMTKTSSLASSHPAVKLSRRNVTVGTYGQPPDQFQRPGPTPFGCNPKLGADCHTPPVQANDTRMNQVIYSDGLLWSGINTGVQPGPRVGVQYYVVRPTLSGRATVGGTVVRQGYVSATNENVSFPSIGVDRSGRGVIAFSLMGRKYYPSAAYVRVNERGITGPIHVAEVGFKPEDGFTCYAKPFGFGPPCRWGDYSASVAGPDGQIWSGAEFIGPHARDIYANWSTFLFPLAP